MGTGITSERVAQRPEHSTQISDRGTLTIGAGYREYLPGGAGRTHALPNFAATLQAKINRLWMPGFQQAKPLFQ